MRQLREEFFENVEPVLNWIIRSYFSVMESLILAQNERWRHGLGMQVERGALGRLVAKG